MDSSSDSTNDLNTSMKDRRHFVYISAFFIGMVILFPWNILITVTTYWNYKFRNVSLDNVATNTTDNEEALTDLQKLYNSYLAIASNIPNATFVILHALFGHHFNIKLRLYGSLVGVVVVLAAITVLSCLDSDGWQEAFLNINMISIAFLNVFSAVFQGSATAVLGMFPAEYLGTMGSGMGIGGLLPSMLNIVIIGASKNSAKVVGVACFCICTALAFSCLGLLFMLQKNTFYQFYATTISRDKKQLYDENRTENTDSIKKDLKIYLSILKDSWMYQLAIFITFVVTLAVFPAVTALVQPLSKGGTKTSWEETYFIPVCCFILFNFGDYIGKEIATRIQYPKPTKRGQIMLLLFSIMRIVFIPLFILCNASPSNRSTEVVFSSEWWYIAFMTIFSISNGYVGNLGFMFAPKAVLPEYQDIAASFTVAMLVGGCGVGSVISNPIVTNL